ncbi:hypothetical protein GALL_482600 [mine drainage metagenome]|uniref:Uncharacterized protein n=1 Tax=mine drainage metagenome TaxID=410659 RepID=A0A1J5PG11_9ZZZZ
MRLKQPSVMLRLLQLENDIELFAPAPKFEEHLAAHGAGRTQ